MLTEGLGRLICAAQGTGGEVRAALGRSSAAGSKQGLSGLLDGTAQPKAVLREGYGVRGAPGPLAARNCSGGAYRRRRSWQRDAAALVVRAWGFGRDGDRAQGSTGVQFKEERRRSWRERKGRPSRRSRRRARVWPVRGRKEEGDSADMWARRGRESRRTRAKWVGAGGDWAAVRQAGRARASERWRLGRAEKTGPRLVRLSGLVAGPNGRRTRARFAGG